MKESTKYAALSFVFILTTIKGCVDLCLDWDTMVMWLKLPFIALLIFLGLLAFYFVSEFEACKKIEDDLDNKKRFYGGDEL